MQDLDGVGVPSCYCMFQLPHLSFKGWSFDINQVGAYDVDS